MPPEYKQKNKQSLNLVWTKFKLSLSKTKFWKVKKTWSTKLSQNLVQT